MKNKTGTVIFVSILCLGLAAAFLQYQKDQENNTLYYESEIIISGEDDDAYDISKSYYENYDDSGLETYIITSIFNEPDVYIQDLRELEYCQYVFENEDGMIEVQMTPEERELWITRIEENIRTVLDDIQDEKLYNLQLSENCTQLKAVASKSCNAEAFFEDIIVLVFNAELYQVLSGCEEWSVNIVIENMDSGNEMVNVQFPQEGWEIAPEMWDE